MAEASLAPHPDASPRRPAFVAAGCLIAGIAFHAHFQIAPHLYLPLAALAILLTLLTLRYPLLSTAFLILALFCTGLTCAQVAAFHYPADHISHYSADTPRLAQFELIIDTQPRTLAPAPAEHRPLPPRQVMQARVLKVLTPVGWVPASGRTLLQINGVHPTLRIRDRVHALGHLSRLLPAMNPGQFDWARYYRDQRILTSLSIPEPDNLTILHSPGPALLDRLRAGARSALAQGFSPDHSIDHALLRALLLGDSDPQLRDVQDDFLRTGTSHHLAISGMHIAILAWFIWLICRLCFLHPRTSTAIALGITLIYGLVVLPSPPVIRSLLLCTAISGGLLFRRHVDGIQLLSLSAIAMLIYHPLDLFGAGFQLSFGTVLGLMLFANRFDAFIQSWTYDRDLAIAEPFIRRTPLQLAMRWAWRKLRVVLAAGVVAWAVSAPIVAWHFNQLNPYAIPAGLLLAIPVSVALIAGVFKLLLTLLFPWGASIWADIATWPISGMRQLADALAKLPGSDVPFPTPPAWLVFVIFGLYAAPLLLHRPARFRRPIWAAPGVAILLACFVPFLLGSTQHSLPPGELRLALLSVGAGQCAVLHLPSGKTILLDAGSTTTTDLYRRTLAPYLRQTRTRAIDSIFISHANYDHYSAVPDVLESMNPAPVHISPHFRTHSRLSRPARMMLESLDASNQPPTILSAPQTLQLDPDTTLEVLWPNPNDNLKSNDASLVLRITYKGRSILLTGDIQQQAQRALLDSSLSLKADVLIAPHHGSHEPTTDDFTRAVSPRFILSSNDFTLTRKQRLYAQSLGNTPLYRTHTHGAIFVRISKEGKLWVETSRTP